LFYYKKYANDKSGLSLIDVNYIFKDIDSLRTTKSIIAEIDKATKYITLKKLFNFIKRHDPASIQDFLITYNDYIEMFLSLGIKTYKYNLLPKDLYKSHDSVNTQVVIKEDPIVEENIQKRYTDFQDVYNLEIKGYHFLLPSSVHDFLMESNRLKHCVQNYASDHSKGLTTIILVRQDINTPLYTLEIKLGTVRQFQGFKHKEPPIEVRHIVDDYLTLINKHKLIAV
jgi:hypothetical protein